MKTYTIEALFDYYEGKPEIRTHKGNMWVECRDGLSCGMYWAKVITARTAHEARKMAKQLGKDYFKEKKFHLA